MLIPEEKRSLQQDIDVGSISSSDALEKYLGSRRWSARTTDRMSKRNRTILIVNPGVDRGFQIEVDFLIANSKIEQPGIWIYALIARAGLEKACYVGQSKSVMRRFSEHLKRWRPGRGADAFFIWAEQRDAEVQAVLLEFSERQGSKGETARNATYLEGAWLSAAVNAGYRTPDVEKWGRLPTSSKNTTRWSEEEIETITTSLDEIVKKSPWLRNFCLKPPAFLL